MGTKRSDPDNMGSDPPDINVDDVLIPLDVFGDPCNCANPNVANCISCGLCVPQHCLNDAGCEGLCEGQSVAPGQDGSHDGMPLFARSASSVNGGPSGPAAAGAQSGIITLVPVSTSTDTSGLVHIDAFVEGPSDLRAYQVTLDVSGAILAGLELVSIAIDENRPDYVFAGVESYSSVNVDRRAMLNVLPRGGVTVDAVGYLATFSFRATGATTASFTLDVQQNDQTLLRDSRAWPVTVETASAAAIVLP